MIFFFEKYSLFPFCWDFPNKPFLPLLAKGNGANRIPNLTGFLFQFSLSDRKKNNETKPDVIPGC
ncbi:hypothetical protein DLM75_21735 [Leptospira stimsonii]|uniref:Uncharacterized protein n=1 Tax=Leptospira stimsonii TaxID=2202203 RepID=A0A396YT42_9LEPT|nr:hypothetical protein DLM75_21735 [Leptospira stimsonii]